MEYKNLIKLVEDKRNKVYKQFKKSKIFKKKYMVYINKYDVLLLELYTKYEKYLTITDI